MMTNTEFEQELIRRLEVARLAYSDAQADSEELHKQADTANSRYLELHALWSALAHAARVMGVQL